MLRRSGTWPPTLMRQVGTIRRVVPRIQAVVPPGLWVRRDHAGGRARIAPDCLSSCAGLALTRPVAALQAAPGLTAGTGTGRSGRPYRAALSISSR